MKNSSTGQYTYVSGAISSTSEPLGSYNGLGELHVDMNGQGHNFFDITENDSSIPTYRIKISADDADYGATQGYLGVKPNDMNYPTAVYAFLDPENEGNACDWILVDFTAYDARVTLYEVLLESTKYSNIDQDAINEATAIYNNESASVEEIDGATKSVKAAEVVAVTQGASQSNPADVTSIIENSDFSTGNVNGWTCTFVSGTSATNIGYQDAYYTNDTYTYTNHEGVEVNPFVNGFIEAWTASQFGDTSVGSSIGDAELCQTIEGLPAGNYKLGADVIAVQQYETVSEQYGVQLYATSGVYDLYTNISTGNGTPEHVDLYFAADGNDVTLGLRTRNTNCNWIAADNFELVYYGNESSAYSFVLQSTISEYETLYPDLDAIHANMNVKTSYEETIANGKNLLSGFASDDEYIAAIDAVTSTGDALAVSIREYESAADEIEYILSLESTAEESGWEGLQDDLSTYRQDDLQAGYDDGTLTSDDISAISDKVSEMIVNYISENVQAGQDISIVIRNNNFDVDFSGWNVADGSTTPAWGGMVQENEIEGEVTIAEINSGDAEVYHSPFDISQTFKNMPAGLYTLTCQAFECDEAGDGVTSELYAVANGAVQPVSLKNINEDGNLEQLYFNSDAAEGWRSDDTTTFSDGTTGFIPASMEGANVYFYLGHYTNTLNVLVTQTDDITIGLRDASSDWVVFDSFRLVYEGNDADSYKDYINELIAEAFAMAENELFTTEAQAKLNDAIGQAEYALESNDIDVIVAAVTALKEALDFGEETLALISEFEELYNYTNDYRLSEIASSSEESFPQLMDEIADVIQEGVIETNAKVEEYLFALKSGFTVYAQYDYLDATEENPADITPVIMTHESVDGEGEGSTFGWEIDGSVGVGEGCLEMYNLGAGNSISQTIYGLAAGFYRLGVQGFYCGANYAGVVDANDVDTIAYNTDIFAGDKATRLLSIKSDAEAYNTLVGGTTEGVWSVPYNMATANNAFEAGLYQNTLQFQVDNDGDEVTIGIRKTALISGDWAIWDKWMLTYLGTAEPSEDPTTAIEDAEAAGAAIATAIYSIDGKQLPSLMKGVNIVKTTMADGSVHVQKVFVK